VNIPTSPERRLPVPAAACIDWPAVHARAHAHCVQLADEYERLVNRAQDAAGDPVAWREAWHAAALCAHDLLAMQAWTLEAQERSA